MKKLLLLSLSCLFLQILFGQMPAISKDKPENVTEDFYQTDKVRELRFTFKSKNWQNQLDSLRLLGNGLLLADLKVDGVPLKNVGIRYRGSKSFQTGSKRNAFHIKLNHTDKQQQLQGYKSLKLSNALRDPSMVREVLGYEIARQYMPAPKANFARLYINEEYYGLFVNVEPVDDVFLKEHFQSADNTLIKAGTEQTDAAPENCKNKIFGSLEYEPNKDCYPYNFELKSDAGWDELIDLTQKLQQESEHIETVLNVDQALWMLAFNNVLVNLNSYSGQESQNYYLYKDNFGHFNPIIWDLNLAFGSFKNTGVGSDLDLEEMQELDPFLHADNPQKPLISQLLKHPLYRKIYLAHLRTLVYEQFVSGQYEQRARALQSLITVPFYNDPNKYYELEDFNQSLTTTVGQRSKIPGIVELMDARARFLKKHPDIAVIPPEVSEVKILHREQFASEKVSEFKIQAKVDKLPKRVKLYYRFGPQEVYKEVYMSDDGLNNDKEAGDKIFGVTVVPEVGKDTMEYYIFTENARAISIFPSNYMFQAYQVKLAELN